MKLYLLLIIIKSEKEEPFLFQGKFMIDSTDPTPQLNFETGNLPPNTQTFYNTKAFAQNEIQFLSTMVSMDAKAQHEGLQKIKDVIKGLS